MWQWAWNIQGIKQLDQAIMRTFIRRMFASLDLFVSDKHTQMSRVTDLTHRLLDPGSEERKLIKIIHHSMYDVSQKLYATVEDARSQNATEANMALQYLQQLGRCDISLTVMHPAGGFFAASYERLAHRRRVGHTKINSCGSSGCSTR